MIINQKNKSMDMEARDINYILPAYVRSYLFHSKNELPERIIFPMFESVNIVGTDRQLISIPIEWVPPLGAIATEISKEGEAIAEVTPEQEAEIDRKDDEIKRLKAEVEKLTTPASTPVIPCARCGGPIEEGIESDICGTCADALREEVIAQAAVTAQTAESALTPAPEDILRQQQEAEPAAPSTSPAKAAFAESSTTKTTEKPPTSERQPKQPPGGDIGPGLPLSDMQARGGKDQVQTAKDLLEEPAIDESAEKPFEKDISRDKDGKPIVEEKPE